MADIYIKNKHGLVHSIPEDMMAQVQKQGCKKITKAEYEKALKASAKAADSGEADAKPAA